MKASLSITVDAPAGDSIDAVAREMVALADRVLVAVRMDSFNGVVLTAYPGSSAQKLVRAYGKAVQSNFAHREADSSGETSAWGTVKGVMEEAAGR